MEQINWIKKIIDLKKENPTYAIKFFVDSEELTDFSYTAHEIDKVRISPWLLDNEEILTDSNRIDIYFEENFLDDPIYNDEKVWKNRLEKLWDEHVKYVILVYTKPCLT